MIIVTGANGFIGSWMVEKLNSEGFFNLVVVDEFRNKKSHNYLTDLQFTKMLDLENLEDWLKNTGDEVEFVIHLGAITDTTLNDPELFGKYNTDYSKKLWTLCAQKQIPFIYASSAATYGDGAYGFKVDYDLIAKLKPLNEYGKSKHAFDLWVLAQKQAPYFWAGLKFFNVFGPEREGHKGKMASMVYQIEQQIRKTGKVKLFKSYHPEFANGEQKRDFIYVKEVVMLILNLMQARESSGIRNIGSGRCKTFNSLVQEISSRINIPSTINYIDMPLELRKKYQYFTST